MVGTMVPPHRNTHTVTGVKAQIHTTQMFLYVIHEKKQVFRVGLTWDYVCAFTNRAPGLKGDTRMTPVTDYS